MKFTIVTFGTEGDTRPLVAVSTGLVNAGHEVFLFADKSTLPTAKEYGIPCGALDGDMKSYFTQNGAFEGLMDDGGSATRMSQAAAEIASQNSEAWCRTVVSHAKSFGSDAVLFSGVASYVGLAAGEILGIPAIGLGVIPIFPTTAFPHPFLDLPFNLPGWANYLSSVLVNTLIWFLFRGKINASRQELANLPPRWSNYSDYPVILGISKYLIPQPQEYLPLLPLVGAWSLPPHESYTPSSDLLSLLSNAQKPIYIGFGSMPIPSSLLRTILTSLPPTEPALYAPGWSKTPDSLPSNILTLQHPVPHTFLFPRCSLAIHHAGCGTSHAALLAGIPSVSVPIAGDQPFWAARLAEVGIGAVVTRGDGSDKIRDAIAFAEDPEVVARAARLGELAREEKGVEDAVVYIEKFVVSEREKLSAKQAKNGWIDGRLLAFGAFVVVGGYFLHR